MDVKIIVLEKQIEKLTERIEKLENYGRSVSGLTNIIQNIFESKKNKRKKLSNTINELIMIYGIQRLRENYTIDTIIKIIDEIELMKYDNDKRKTYKYRLKKQLSKWYDYEAIQMFSEDYARENDYKTALYNGILSKLDKYDFVSAKETSKSEVWIIHRTLRKKGIEVYVGFNTETDWRVELFDGTIGTTKDKKNAYKFEFAEAVKVRDDLNKRRVGKQYLWVISKVEE